MSLFIAALFCIYYWCLNLQRQKTVPLKSVKLRVKPSALYKVGLAVTSTRFCIKQYLCISLQIAKATLFQTQMLTSFCLIE